MYRILLTTISVLLLNSFSANAESLIIPYPKNYETEYLNYLSVDRKNNRQTARLFANITAMVGVQRFGDFPDGSVLVMEISDVKKNTRGVPLKSSLGRLINDGKYAVYVMQKNTNADGADAWAYAAFSPKGEVLKTDLKACAVCHAAIRKSKNVFSYDHLEKSELGDYADRISRNIEKRFVESSAKQISSQPVSLPLKSERLTPSEKTDRFIEHSAINSVIREQLVAFRDKNVSKAYDLAAPQIRSSFHNSDYFMHIIRVAYPQLLNFKNVQFPDLRKIDGNAFSQIVTVQDSQGNRHKVRYMMLKISGKWKIAGCSIL